MARYKLALGPSPSQLQSFLQGQDDEPFVMVNLLVFKPWAEYPSNSKEGRSQEKISGEEAYRLYAHVVEKLLSERGGRVVYMGRAEGLLMGEVEPRPWDMVALAEYPSLTALRSMIESPEYKEAARHRMAGLQGQLHIKTRPVPIIAPLHHHSKL